MWLEIRRPKMIQQLGQLTKPLACNELSELKKQLLLCQYQQ
jgi:hypothetical protein